VSSLRNGLILAAFALLSTGLTAITWVLTKDRIQSEKELALLRAISQLVPADRFANDPYQDCTLITFIQCYFHSVQRCCWRLRDVNGKPVAVVISSIAANGYNGKIELIVGHYFTPSTKTQHKLAGVRVTDHKETPGLGDKVDPLKSDWILQFAGLQTEKINQQHWQVKKDGGQFDAFTGATITPRAVLQAVGKNISYFTQNQQQIFSAAANCNVSDEGDLQ